MTTPAPDLRTALAGWLAPAPAHPKRAARPKASPKTAPKPPFWQHHTVCDACGSAAGTGFCVRVWKNPPGIAFACSEACAEQLEEKGIAKRRGGRAPVADLAPAAPEALRLF